MEAAKFEELFMTSVPLDSTISGSPLSATRAGSRSRRAFAIDVPEISVSSEPFNPFAGNVDGRGIGVIRRRPIRPVSCRRSRRRRPSAILEGAASCAATAPVQNSPHGHNNV